MMTAMNQIVVWGEHTPCAAAAVRWAVAKAETSGADVVVVRPFDRTRRADLRLEGDLERARRDARFRTQSWVVGVVADLDTSVPVVVSTPDSSVEKALAAAAEGALMLVIGAEHAPQHELVAALAEVCSCPVVEVREDLTAAPYSLSV